MTSGDRIRQMSNEELAEVIEKPCMCCKYQYVEIDNCIIAKCECIEGIKAYLESEEK